MINASEEKSLNELGNKYRELRIRQGWKPMSSEQMLNLPYGTPPGYDPIYWKARRRSFGVLINLLAKTGPKPESGPIADLGAGSGWMSYRLAQAGYRVVALEGSMEGDFGLGEINTYTSKIPDRIFPVRGNIEKPPFRPSSLSTAIFNASLHYVEDIEATILRTKRSLIKGGTLIIMDTPVSDQPKRGTTIGDRHFGRSELENIFISAGFEFRWLEIRHGLIWWIRGIKSELKRRPRFSFPLIVALKS